MIDQLDVFLQQETRGFVDKLFVTLANKSYLQSVPTEAVATSDVVPAVNGALVAASVAPIEADKANDVGKVESRDHDKGDSRSDLKKKSTVVATNSTSSSAVDRLKRKSFSPRSRSRSRSRERLRRSRSRDRTRDRGGRGWEERRRRSPVTRRTERRRSRSPARRSRSPRNNRRAYSNRSRSRSPKGISPRSPATAAAAAAVTASKADGGLVDGVQSIADVIPAPVTLPIQSVIVTPADNRPKFRCRDYDEKGYCMRGDLCPYDHGADPVVLEDVELSSMLKYNRPPPGAPPVVCPPPHLRGPPPSLPPPGTLTYISPTILNFYLNALIKVTVMLIMYVYRCL